MTVNVRRLTRDEARRIAIRAQLLDADRPRDLLTMVGRLTMLQLDPTAAVAPSADLAAWTRLGSAYEPAQLQQALERDRTVFEHRGQAVPTEPVVVMVRPMADLGLHLADMANWSVGWKQHREWVAANDGFRRRVLDLLGASGPLASRDIPDSAEVILVHDGARPLATARLFASMIQAIRDDDRAHHGDDEGWQGMQDRAQERARDWWDTHGNLLGCRRSWEHAWYDDEPRVSRR